MSDAIEQRVDEFVREIMSLVHEASGESRVAALRALTDMAAHTSSKAAPKRAPRAAAAPEKKAAPAPKAPAAAPSAPPHGTEAAPQSSPAPLSGPGRERESVVLAALRALGQATASEVAGRTGQPNGSVTVVLRSLVSRGQVARLQTPKGVEYTLATPSRRARG